MRLTSFALILASVLGCDAPSSKQGGEADGHQDRAGDDDGAQRRDVPSAQPVAFDTTKILAEVEAVSDVRKKIAVEWESTREAIGADPEASAERITTLLEETFAEHPRVDALFGRELASLDPKAIKSTFELYEAVHRLQTELALLAGFVASHADVLKAAGGPTAFGVVFKSDGAVLVDAKAPLCGSGTATLDTLGPCTDPSDALAYKTGVSLSADEPLSIIVRGRGDGEMQLLLPEGAIYNYAIGLEPAKNALKVLQYMAKRVEEQLVVAARAEARVLTALRAE